MGCETKITCDQCEQDIAETGGMPEFRLKLSCEKLPHTGGMVYAVMVYPPIEKSLYFCGTACLGEWVGQTHPDSHERYEGMMKHRENK